MAMTAPSSSDLTRAPLTMFSEEEELFRAAVADLAESEVRPRVRAMEDAGQIDPALTAKFVELGLMGIELPDEFGGAGGSLMMVAIAVEELSKVDASAAIQVDVQNTLVNYPLYRYGNAEPRARILPRMTAGTIGAYALSEPGSGSDAFGLATRAEKVDGGWTLNGSKAWITNGNEADVFVVFANTRPDMGYKGITAFIVERGATGFSVGKKEHKLGICASSTTSLHFENTFVSDANVLGEVGTGYKIAIETLNEGRIGIGAQMIGVAQGALTAAVAHLKERKQFGKPLADFQATQFKLADMATDLDAARLLIWRAAALLDQKSPEATQAAAMGKRFATDAGFRVVNEALQLHGGYGYLKDFPLERYLRDLRVHQILEGTNEIMRVIISRRLLMS